MQRIDFLVGRLSEWLAMLSSVFLLLIVLGTTADVVMRHATNQPIPGTVEYTEVLLVSLVFLSMARAQRTDLHVGVSLVIDRLPEVWRSRFVLIGLAVMTAVVVWLAVLAGIEAMRSISSGEYRWGLLRVPMWPARVAVFVGLALLSVETVLSMYRLVRTSTEDETSWHG